MLSFLISFIIGINCDDELEYVGSIDCVFGKFGRNVKKMSSLGVNVFFINGFLGIL